MKTTVSIDPVTHRTTVTTGQFTTVYAPGPSVAGQIGILHEEIIELRERVAELEEVIRHCAIGQAPEAIRRVFDEVNYEAAEAAGGDS